MKVGNIVLGGVVVVSGPLLGAVATNAFVISEADGIRTAGDTVFHIPASKSRTAVRVTARPGWRFQSGERSKTLTFASTRGGSHKIVSDLGEDGELIEYVPCTVGENAEDIHMFAPVINVSATAREIGLYPVPETSTDVSAAASASVVSSGQHLRRTIYTPCPICGRTEPATEETYSTGPTSYEWTASGPGKTVNGPSWSGPVSAGADSAIRFTVVARCKDCSGCWSPGRPRPLSRWARFTWSV